MDCWKKKQSQNAPEVLLSMCFCFDKHVQCLAGGPAEGAAVEVEGSRGSSAGVSHVQVHCRLWGDVQREIFLEK